ncbi:MAG TPA: polyribonucleotide nucleotidyltransferase [Spirochaetota bacterium]|nr:polyribonucleotide nucleotidyltransferase [Spirochaetota bacterium]HOS55414.1 polyribonucleotide nucleotidyltransferase [Spirochaetota bacterium]HPK62383.1 polyribonucleotide nucleotidyltransferase [Spirochaetota bacterium]HQF76862.1 polyribonucleotide nucleotidyltransferase [Spirochaetota bacterium]HRU43301.1 polyribonucleotide nucleotidyltransferase [Spirochaetota bacterium]
MLQIQEKKFMIGDKEIVITLGEYALQANGSVVLRCGETLVQAIVVMGVENPDLDFFPLTVEYNENLYAGGMIKSNRFTKREGRPSDEAILKARLIDRSIRPLFPKDFYREVQVIINILSSDKTNPHDVLGLTAAIAALAVSDIPFDCSLGGIRMSYVDNNFVINPTYAEIEKQSFELVLAGNDEKIVMIECAADCVKDDLIEKGFEASFKPLGLVSQAMVELQNSFGKKKAAVVPKVENAEIKDRIFDFANKKIEEFSTKLTQKEATKNDYDEIVANPVVALFTEEELEEKYPLKEVKAVLDKIFKEKLRENILLRQKRIDGRGIEDIREIQIKLNPIPRVHGSSMFMRGETQILNILTLSAPGNEQIIEALEGESLKRYIHHYNAPPYSVGEVGRYGGAGRREIGHGALAEKALKPVIPPQSEFPYVIRLVSEVMGQNGSSSMASTCASTLSLMVSGVPIKCPIAGISIGLITGDTDDVFQTITDIMGYEDFGGDMDFKVAGSADSITAIQMDTKIKGLTFPIIKQALKQAKAARNKILDIISAHIKEPSANISQYAPKIDSTQIPVDSIGKVIGPGGKTIKQLSADYNVELSIDDDGVVNISSMDKESIDKVKRVIDGMTKDPIVGQIYSGKVVRLMDFGAFVEIFPGKEGLVHISKMSKERVAKVTDVVNVGQVVDVKLLEIDSQQRLNFSMNLDDKETSGGRSNFGQRREVRTNNRR